MKAPNTFSKREFYQNKSVVRIEWCLDTCYLPNLRWARLRVFEDGTADSCFNQGGKIYAFENRDYASYILSEDEYTNFENMDIADEQEYGINLTAIAPPLWQDTFEQEFEYLETY